ncbi:PilZ domain-containing protein [Emcibacter sp.]|uniref:PilZ domain-containing protein n=1 Tax=Emcibacter sp. TaxID=1979954 RepID=UPI002AA7D69B|nr:PilZ domain-containing protein [Emcibacter sp.]
MSAEAMSNEDKRNDSRLDVFWRAMLTIDGISYPCELTNVSTAGALMVLDRDLDLKQEFILDIADLGQCGGRVVWCNRPQYGLQLLIGDDLKLKDFAEKIGLRMKA